MSEYTMSAPNRHQIGTTNVATTTSDFDYTQFDAASAALARRTAAKFRVHQRRVTGEFIDIGSDLNKVKVALEHGKFGEWLKAEFGKSARTAQKYMRAAEIFGPKCEVASYLPEKTIHILAAKSTPETLVGTVISRLEGGECLDAIEAYIHDARQRFKQQTAEARLSDKARKDRAKKAAKYQQQREEYQVQRQREKAAAQTRAEVLLAKHGAEAVRDLLVDTDWETQDALRVLTVQEVPQ